METLEGMLYARHWSSEGPAEARVPADFALR